MQQETLIRRRRGLTRVLVWSLAAGLAMPTPAVLAGPGDGQVVQGQGTIQVISPDRTVITQESQRLAIDWQEFNVAANETVVFDQPNASAVALNRILSQDPSQIFGAIDANGRVFLVNPSGIYFGPEAQVNVASLVATTLDLSVDDFMQGNYDLQALADRAGGLIVNRGTLAAATGGSVALVGGEVRNDGLIVADVGRVVLAAGERATVDFDGDGMLLFALGEGTAREGSEFSVLNSGGIAAAGGEVLMSAQAARDVVSSVVNNEGLVEAGRIENQGGVIRLVASGGTATNAGVLDASGVGDADVGGSVSVLGEAVTLTDGARVLATGGAGGGEVMIGGGGRDAAGVLASRSTVVSSEALIDVSATARGDGGRASVWSAGTTDFQGTAAARAGAAGGDGGSVVVGGGEGALYLGNVDLRAPAGDVGRLSLQLNGQVEVCDAGLDCVNDQANVFTDAFINAFLANVGDLEINTDDADDGPAGSESIIFRDGDDINITLNANLTLTAQENVEVRGTISSVGAEQLIVNVGQSGTNTDGDPDGLSGLLTVDADLSGLATLEVNGSAAGSEQVLFTTAPPADLRVALGDAGDSSDVDLVSVAGVSTAVDLTILTAGQWSGVETVVGDGALHTLIIADGLDVTWDINASNSGTLTESAISTTFTDWANLQGSNDGVDTFAFTGSGDLTGTLDGGTGVSVDTVDYRALATAEANVGNITNVATVFGDGAGFDLRGDDVVTTWDVTGADTVEVGGISYQGWESILGGSAADTVVFASGGSLGGNIDGGTGAAVDTVDYRALAAVAVDVETISNVTTVFGNGAAFDLRGDDVATTWNVNGANTVEVNGVSYQGWDTIFGGTDVDTFQLSGAGALDTIDGGAGTDTLAGASGVVNTFTIDAADGGSITAGAASTPNFAQVENLTGNDGADAFNFAVGGSLSGVIDGGTGAAVDTVDYRALAAATVDVQSITNVATVFGNGAGFELRGDDVATTWSINGANTVEVGGVSYQGWDTIVGGTEADTFQLSGAGALDTIDGGDGTDTIVGAAGVVNTFTIDEANGGELTAGAAATPNFTQIESLTGNNGADEFIFASGGSLSGTASGAGGDDIFRLSGGSVTNILGGSSGQTNGDRLVGGAGGANTFTVDGADEGTVVYAGGTISFDQIENLDGNDGADVFEFAAGGSLSGSASGLDGDDTFELTGGFASNIVGGSSGQTAGDEIVGAAGLANTFTVDAADGGTVMNTDGTSAFSEIENLTGNDDADAFDFEATGSLSGTVSGADGDDTFSFTDATQLSVTLAGGAGMDTADYSGIATPFSLSVDDALATSIEVAIGAGANFTVLGADRATTWNITDANTFTSVEDAVRFENWGILTGGTDTDTFVLDGGFVSSIVGSATPQTDGDELIGAAGLANTFTVDADDGGTVMNTDGMSAFSEIENLTGNDGADAFDFEATGSLSGTVSGAAGDDTFSFTDATQLSVTLAGGAGMDTANYSGIATPFSLSVDDALATSIEVAIGAGANFTVLGADRATTWNITDTNTFTSVEDAVRFENWGILTGGTDTDTFVLDGGFVSSIVGSATPQTDGDELIGAAGLANTFTVDAADGGTVMNTDGTSAFSEIENLTGNDGADGFDFEATGSLSGTVSGADGDDTFSFTDATQLSVTLAGGAGMDTADYSGIATPFSLSVDDALATSIEVAIGAGANFTVLGADRATTWNITDANTFTSVEDAVRFENWGILTGGTDTDTFVLDGGFVSSIVGSATPQTDGDELIGAAGLANTFTVDAADGGTVMNTDGTSAFSEIESLTGNDGADVFDFEATGSLSGDAVGAGGDDTFAFSADGQVTGALDGGAANDIADFTALGSGFELLVSEFDETNIETVRGLDATLLGDDVATTWSITGENILEVEGVTFEGWANLVGGSATDTFTLDGGAVVDITGSAMASDDADLIIGGAGSTNTFTVDAADGGTVLYDGGMIAFSEIENLTGNDGADEFSFDLTGTLSGNATGADQDDVFTFTVAGQLAGALDGGAGTDTADYAALAAPFTLSAEQTRLSSIELALGGGTDFTVQGENTATTWSITGDNAFMASEAGTSFQGWGEIVGGTATDTFVLDGGTLDSIVGSAMAADDGDVLIGASTDPNIFTLSAADSGMVAFGDDAISFSEIENLTGNALADEFHFESTGSLSGDATGAGGDDLFVFTVDGQLGGLLAAGDGTDTADYSALATPFELSVDAALADAIEIAIGNGEDFTVRGQDVASTWQITGVNEFTVAESGVSFQNWGSILGGSGADTFELNGGSVIDIAGSAMAGDDNDLIIGASGSAYAFAVSGADAGTVTYDMNAIAFSEIENLTGADQADSFDFAVAGSLSGDASGLGGDDSFVFTLDGQLAGALAGGDGTDTASYAALSAPFVLSVEETALASIEVAVGNGDDFTVRGQDVATTWDISEVNEFTDTQAGIRFENWANLVGGSATDTFQLNGGALASITGSAAPADDGDVIIGQAGSANTFTLTGADAGTAAYDMVTIAFSEVENLTGNDQGDTFSFELAGSLSGDAVADQAGQAGDDLFVFTATNQVGGTLSAGDGMDTADYTALATPFTVTVDELLAGAFEAALGAGSDFAVQGADADVTWDIFGVDEVRVSGISFGGWTSLLGGAGVDTFEVNGGTVSNVAGGGGEDVLRGQLDASNQFTLNAADGGDLVLAMDTIAFSDISNLIGGNEADQFQIADGTTGALSGSLDGGRGADTLIAGSVQSTFTIAAAGAGALDGTGAGNDIASFTGLEALTGNVENDVFNFDAMGDLTVSIDGGGAGDVDRADYSAVAAAVTLAVDSLTNIEEVVGDGVNDTLLGGAAGSNWVVSGENDGTVGAVAFVDWSMLLGSDTGADTFTIDGGTVVSIDGGGMAMDGDSLIGESSAENTFTLLVQDGGTLAWAGNTTSFSNIENLTGGSQNDRTILSGGALTGVLDGAAGVDVIEAADVRNVYHIDGADSGALAGDGDLNDLASYVNVENLTGNNQNDDFVFGAMGSLSGVISAGAGTDLVDFTLVTEDVTFSLALNSGLEQARGGAGVDTLIGPDLADVSWLIDANDAGQVAETQFSSWENLTGGSGIDTFTIAGGVVSGMVDGGAGSDALLAADVDSTFSLSGIDEGALEGAGAGNDVASFLSVERLIGGAGADSFIALVSGVGVSGLIDGGDGVDLLQGAPDGVNEFLIDGADSGSVMGVTDVVAFQNTENLTGGELDDSFTFVGAGTLSGIIDGGAQVMADSVSVAAAGEAIVDLTRLLDIELLTGAGSDSTLVGGDVATAWTLGGGVDDGVDDGLIDGSVVFVDFGTLLGGTAADTFTVDGGAVSNRIDGGAGAGDVLVGADVASTYTFSSLGGGALDGAGAGNDVAAFADIESVVGGAADDVFVFVDAGELLGTLGAGAGVDTLDLAQGGSGAPLTVNLQEGSVDVLAGGAADAFASIETFVGDGQLHTLVAADASNTWRLGDGVDDGVNDGTINGNVTFVDFTNLVGGAAADSFALADGSITGMLNGGAGVDELLATDGDTQFTIDAIDGGTLVTAGSDLNQVARYAAIEQLTGGTGADVFVLDGGAVSVALNGGAGEDSLLGADMDSTFNLQGVDQGSVVTEVALTNSVASFIAVENLFGGSADDTFALAAGASLSGALDGGGQSVADVVTVADANGVVTVALADLTEIERVIGSGDDTLVDDDTDSTIIIGGGLGDGVNDGFVDAIEFIDFAAVLGGAGDERFEVAGGVVQSIDGGAGSDTLSGDDVDSTFTIAEANGGALASTGGDAVLTFAGVESLFGGSAADTFVLQAEGTVSLVDGGAGADTLVGADVASVFTIDATGSRVVGSDGLTSVDRFVAIEQLVGGALGDTFAVVSAAGLGSLESLAGGGGDDLFTITDASVFTTLTTLSGDAGDDQFTIGDLLAESTTLFAASIFGGAGNDSLTLEYVGQSVRNFTFDGGEGDDTVTLQGGGAGFSSLVDLGESIVQIDGSGPQVLTFLGTEVLNEATVADTFTFIGTDGSDSLSLAGSAGGGIAFEVDGLGVVTSDNKGDVTIDTAGGADSVALAGDIVLGDLAQLNLTTDTLTSAGGSVSAQTFALTATSAGAAGAAVSSDVTTLDLDIQNAAFLSNAGMTQLLGSAGDLSVESGGSLMSVGDLTVGGTTALDAAGDIVLGDPTLQSAGDLIDLNLLDITAADMVAVVDVNGLEIGAATTTGDWLAVSLTDDLVVGMLDTGSGTVDLRALDGNLLGGDGFQVNVTTVSSTVDLFATGTVGQGGDPFLVEAPTNAAIAVPATDRAVINTQGIDGTTAPSPQVGTFDLLGNRLTLTNETVPTATEAGAASAALAGSAVFQVSEDADFELKDEDIQIFGRAGEGVQQPCDQVEEGTACAQ